eukprot:2417698-Prymnesium_polylepis.1
MGTGMPAHIHSSKLKHEMAQGARWVEPQQNTRGWAGPGAYAKTLLQPPSGAMGGSIGVRRKDAFEVEPTQVCWKGDEDVRAERTHGRSPHAEPNPTPQRPPSPRAGGPDVVQPQASPADQPGQPRVQPRAAPGVHGPGGPRCQGARGGGLSLSRHQSWSGPEPCATTGPPPPPPPPLLSCCPLLSDGRPPLDVCSMTHASGRSIRASATALRSSSETRRS